MAAILRPTDHQAAQAGVAFHWDDMTTRANTYLDKVRQEAAGIIAEARRQAEQIRQTAERAGRQAGQQAVAETVARQLDEKLQTLMPALQQLVTQLEHARQSWLSHWEKAALAVAVAIAERLVRRHVAQTPEIAVTLLREALEMAAGSATLRIHLHPADLQTLQPQLHALTQELAPMAQIEWLPEAEIAPGGCRVETQFGEIDQQWETQLQRIQEELT